MSITIFAGILFINKHIKHTYLKKKNNMNFFSRLNSRAPYYDDNDDGDDIRKIFKMHHMYHTSFFKEILFFT